jgi:hypothetical protein
MRLLYDEFYRMKKWLFINDLLTHISNLKIVLTIAWLHQIAEKDNEIDDPILPEQGGRIFLKIYIMFQNFYINILWSSLPCRLAAKVVGGKVMGVQWIEL